MHSLDPIVWSTKSLHILSFLYVWQDTKKTLSELWSIGIEIQFKYLLLDKHIISTSDICPSIQYFLFTYIPVSFLLTTVKNSKETRIKICIHAQFRCPIFDPLSKLLHRRAREKSRALVRPFFVAKPVQGVCVCSVWIRGSPSVGSRWKPLLKRSRRRWKSGIENWFQAGTELGGVARSGVADTGWWGAIRFAGVVGEGWQRQVMVYSYSQSGSGVRWGEIASCQAYTSLFFTQLIPDLSSRCIKRDYYSHHGFYRDRSRLWREFESEVSSFQPRFQPVFHLAKAWGFPSILGIVRSSIRRYPARDLSSTNEILLARLYPKTWWNLTK